jgi:transcriptional regulator with XRE-family HTH domain
MDIRKGFAKALREIRKKTALTQEDFSDVSSRTYLSTLERGLKSPTLDKVSEIASVMGIHPATLIAIACCRAEKIDMEVLCERILSEAKKLMD